MSGWMPDVHICRVLHIQMDAGCNTPIFHFFLVCIISTRLLFYWALFLLYALFPGIPNPFQAFHYEAHRRGCYTCSDYI